MNIMFARYHFSATLRTSDAAVLHCLIGLCHWAQRGELYQQIGWGGCGEKDWQKGGGGLTFRFTSLERREAWHAKANELLSGKWTLTSTNDNDPAFPAQSHADYRQELSKYRSAIHSSNTGHSLRA